MGEFYLTNSLTRKKEKFIPLNPPQVGIYTCGPTVYGYAHIGNLRTYVVADILVRALEHNRFSVNHVMNITDVGHLTGDGDLGTDKVEAKAKLEGKTAWDIAKFYTQAFLKDAKSLNLRMVSKLPKATDHIKEQIELVKKLEEKGFTYKTSDGIYFDTRAFEKKTGKKYGELSTLDKIRIGVRVEENPEKKNPRDFALWKFSEKPGARQMEWDSPWGIGFPGWHIECSAMSMKYLGESFDIHVGGEDLLSTHHPNEIAQSEAVSGKPFVRFWVHATFLQVDGKKMSKSLNNFYTLDNLEEKGFDPLSLRYLYLTAHYRDPLNFTWEALSSAQTALDKLRAQVLGAKAGKKKTTLSEAEEKGDEFREKFIRAINDDLGTPKALAIFWRMLKSSLPSEDKYDLALTFDEVMGLNLSKVKEEKVRIPQKVKALLEEREKLRAAGKFKEADIMRKRIDKLGFRIEDIPEGARLKKIREGLKDV